MVREGQGALFPAGSVLKDAFGNEVELHGEDGLALVFRIKAEWLLGDIRYAALQSEDMRDDDEVEFFRVDLSGSEPALESIGDDDEWEAVSEAYDDLFFADDARP
ncbi:DUF1292 domain-containing protein [Paenibacillus sp. J5C_2022]|uniref:DUF1292 domain-containing protein n=1 Tax=Paenibacillus sp. J5C2022 TaxID=2977129 RepID=UPI0021D0377E|nr:DUF1292 domain-containing protein [Paenibacillus sp. J5C2022]MCU6709651.1 DUF1292 domain-containing protein [Paenibacillus sp. J5C2022]